MECYGMNLIGIIPLCDDILIRKNLPFRKQILFCKSAILGSGSELLQVECMPFHAIHLLNYAKTCVSLGL